MSIASSSEAPPAIRDPGRRHPEVAIVGGGIGGLTLALALQHHGIACRVFELCADVRAEGAGIRLSPNATRLLRRLGLYERLREVAIRPAALEINDWASGRRIFRATLGDECERLFGAPLYTVLRQDLHRALGLAAASTCAIVREARVTSLEPIRGGVTVHFDGGAVRDADVVVGADGIHSTVGRLLHDRPLTFSGHAVYRGVAPGPARAREPSITVWSGPTQHCIAYPVTAAGAVAFAAVVACDGPEDESGSRGDLTSAYQGWASEVHELFASAGTLRRLELWDRPPISTWVRGRIALLGDAAHPMLPFLAQGANSAIEDAFIIASCLAECWPDEVEAALQRYQALRLARACNLHKEARARAPEASRRGVSGTTARASYLDRQRWIYGYDAEQAIVNATQEDGKRWLNR